MDPRQTEDVTVWEIIACIDGHNRINGIEEAAVMTGDEFEYMIEQHSMIVGSVT